MINVLLGNVCVEVLTLNEAQEELVHNLYVRPCHFQHWLIFLWIKCLTLRVEGRWYRPEQVLAEHLYRSWIHWLCDNLSVVCDIIQEIVQSHALDLFRFRIRAGVVEVEYDVALVNLLHEKVLSAVRRDLVETRQFLEIALSLIRDVESRRMLSLWRPDTVCSVSRCRTKGIEHGRFYARLWWCQITRHRFCGTGLRRMLIVLAQTASSAQVSDSKHLQLH